jgi:Tol biopolymer transport system component
MGEVYRAVDTRLGRDVALKVLPAQYSTNAQLRARLEREARTISSLNHPNICTLFDIGRHEEIDYLVMEFCEGESLAERTARGAIPADQAVRIAIEIADALDKAHRAGIVHRDLKPGNVILTRSGAKLLDFGLAKNLTIFEPSPDASMTADLSRTEPLTQEGTIVGTFQYMAPEQIEHGEVDARTDIFSFGAVLYEMLTGRRAFDGSSRASMIAKILGGDPPPVCSLQPLTPRSLEHIVRICLQKNPDDRYQTARDAIIALQWVKEEQSQPSAAVRSPQIRQQVRRERIFWIALMVIVVAVAAAMVVRSKQPAGYRFLTRTTIPAPPESHFLATGDYAGTPVISPDGRMVAFVAAGPNGRRSLWVRPLDALSAKELDGTNNAQFPFWSTDSHSLAFFADSKLKTLDLSSGPPVVIADARDARGGTWSADGTIIFAPATRDGLFRVPATGGTPVRLTKLSGHMTTHRWPSFLPGGKYVLYVAANHNATSSPEGELHVMAVDGSEDKVLMPTLANAVYASGHLLFMRDTTLYAQPFDSDKRELMGKAESVEQNVRFDLSTWHGVFDASQNGALIYQPGGNNVGTRIFWLDNTGRRTPAVDDLAKYFDVSISPDGKRAALAVGDPQSMIWILDLQRNVRTRLTFEGSVNAGPIWTPDGREIVYSSADTDNGQLSIYRRSADGSGQRVKLCCSVHVVASSVHDGTIAAVAGDPGTSRNAIWAIPLVGGTPAPVVDFGFQSADPKYSPDGKWIVYSSNENGRAEIYVIAWPRSGGKWQVSSAGGRLPRWSRDGSHIYYITPDDMLTTVAVRAKGETLEIGESTPLFRLPINPTANAPYDVGPDGRILSVGTEEDAAPIAVVTNWNH